MSAERIQIELPEMAEELASRFASSPSALHVSALTYAELKQTTKAESRWRQCLELVPKDSGPYVGLASVLIERGEDVEALGFLKLVRTRANPSSQFFQTFSEALSRTGDLTSAKEVLLEGVELFPEDGKLWYQLGTVDIQLQNLPEAEKSLRKSILVSGGTISVRNSLIGVLARLGKQQEALELRDQNQNKTVERDQFQEQYEKELRAIASRLFRLAASVAIEEENDSLAEAWLLEAIAISPQDVIAYLDLSTFCRKRARFEETLEIQVKLLAIQPENIVNYINMASIASQLNRLDLAERTLMEAIKVSPNVAFIHGELAGISLAMRRFSLARERAIKASELDQENVEYPLIAAAASEALGDLSSREGHLKRARQISPSDKRLLAFPSIAQ